MARYVSWPTCKGALQVRASSDCDHWDNGRLEPVPTVSDSDAVDTGLLDVDGNAIMRLPNPIGFGKDDEW